MLLNSYDKCFDIKIWFVNSDCVVNKMIKIQNELIANDIEYKNVSI